MPLKRLPLIEESAHWPTHKIPKSEWVEMYRDLYLQTHGEDTGLDWLEDALKRREILRHSR